MLSHISLMVGLGSTAGLSSVVRIQLGKKGSCHAFIVDTLEIVELHQGDG